MGRHIFVAAALSLSVFLAIGGIFWPPAWALLAFTLPVVGLGFYDMYQPEHAILRNFPVIGHFRYFLEAIRPEMHQYFIESDTNGTPFSRELRSIVYQRAKGVLDTVPFGTRHNVYGEGYEWIDHALSAKPPPHDAPRVRVGADTCEHPYDASLLNISAMSFGALSKQAILALNGGARDGGFAHNTGEGSISDYHLEPGGDLIWQLGTGYFGARTPDGHFDRDLFSKNARQESVKMIEVKVSQGAKPGHGGILPAAKITPEIARIRNVPLGQDVISPPTHSAFSTPVEMMAFLAELRTLSGGKPVGFKLCVGRPQDIFALIKAMIETGEHPDFITVDGGEGGTGAAPIEFTNTIGAPLYDGLTLMQAALVGTGMRDKVKLIASGRIITGFDMAVRIALGADLCNSARGMMLALGCIQALRCNSNHCPAGVATQDQSLAKGLVPDDKRKRVTSYHKRTVHSLLEVTAAAGLEHPGELTPDLFHRRVEGLHTTTYAEYYPQVATGAFLEGNFGSDRLRRAWEKARPDSF